MGGDPPGEDPLGREIERWTRFVRENPSTGELWKQVKEGSEPALERAAQALRDGRPLLALLRFAAVHESLVAAEYLGERPAAERADPLAFEAEWKRMGELVAASRAPAGPRDPRPAAVRAMGESALPQARVYYEASLDYGRNTMLENGLYYLGAARARSDFERFTREVGAPAALGPPDTTGPRTAPGPPGSQPPRAGPPRTPPLRGLEPELDALEGELLAAYRPPASIDRHREFIVASSLLKEARELDGAGLRYGALLRYLQAALESAPLRPAPRPAGKNPIESESAGAESAGAESAAAKPAGDPAVAARLRAFEELLFGGEIDHSLGRLFLEIAHAGLEEPPAGAGAAEAGPARAAAIADDILPRYLAALEPARPRAPRPEPRVTVTLVRWPYT
jgi:hypothetical protein